MIIIDRMRLGLWPKRDRTLPPHVLRAIEREEKLKAELRHRRKPPRDRSND